MVEDTLLLIAKFGDRIINHNGKIPMTGYKAKLFGDYIYNLKKKFEKEGFRSKEMNQWSTLICSP